MANLLFRKILDLGGIPSAWTLVRLAADWNGLPILLFVEGKPPRPDASTIASDPWAFTRWYQTAPKAHHAIFFDGQATRTICFERSQSVSTFHLQPLPEGWLLADRRGGCGNVHDASGRFPRSIDLGDAIEDLQTTPNGKIWASYFDEGVFGGGIGKQGAVCFDANGNLEFKYNEFAEEKGLPFISDCYAMNVDASGDVWLNYYTDFPLVRLHECTLARVWADFGVLGNAFAVRDTAVIYADKERFASLQFEGTPEPLVAKDESGASLHPPSQQHPSLTARGRSLLLNAGSAVYISTK